MMDLAREYLANCSRTFFFSINSTFLLTPHYFNHLPWIPVSLNYFRKPSWCFPSLNITSLLYIFIIVYYKRPFYLLCGNNHHFTSLTIYENNILSKLLNYSYLILFQTFSFTTLGLFLSNPLSKFTLSTLFQNSNFKNPTFPHFFI
jgi:hypothetical protein